MKNLKTTLFVFMAAFLLAGLFACAPAPTPAPVATEVPIPSVTPEPTIAPLDTQRTLMIDGMERTYSIHIPAGLTGQQSPPLVFVFHGYQENSAQIRRYTGFDAVADANGFIVVYPDGSGSSGSFSWNGSGCCGYALQNDIDDPAFVRAIIADVETLATVDAKRIYASGFSNGALLSYRLACEMSDTFAAIAPVGGVLMYAPCEPQESVSVIHAHGAKDAVVPLDGGGAAIQFPPVAESVAAWAGLNGCNGEKQVEKDGVLEHTTFEGCKTGIAVELYIFDGTSHSWPSPYVVPLAEIIWEFFAAHPKP
jgi:polyhydroxybutyrate depolymerase